MTNDPAGWKSRADELRESAARVTDLELRHALLLVADRYDVMAELVPREERKAPTPLTPLGDLPSDLVAHLMKQARLYRASLQQGDRKSVGRMKTVCGKMGLAAWENSGAELGKMPAT